MRGLGVRSSRVSLLTDAGVRHCQGGNQQRNARHKAVGLTNKLTHKLH